MKVYNLPMLAELNPKGEYLLGSQDLNSNIISLLYGRLRPNEASKEISTAEGREEIICVVKGSLKIRCGRAVFSVNAGEAFHTKGFQTFFLDNPYDEEAIYLCASGSSVKEESTAANKEAIPADTTSHQEHDTEHASVQSENEYEISKDFGSDEAEDNGEKKVV